MKKILLPMLAVAALVAAPAAYARTMTNDSDYATASWHVLSDANTHSCFASNQPAASGETVISGPYSSESQATSAAGSNVQCLGEYGSHNT